jgi:xanthine dehydrogenase YagR molybdenum-binding subunit
VTTQVEVEGRVETKIVELPAHEPPPWKPDESLRIVGRRIPRVDAGIKVTGQAVFTADVTHPRMLHAVVVRANVARGRITHVDATAARALPGVIDLITASDLPRPIKVGGIPLFPPDISYAGQPVAAVCATTLAAARRGADAVVVQIEPLPHVQSVSDAVEPDAPLVRRSGNVMEGEPTLLMRGDVGKGLQEAAVVITREYRTPSVLHSAMEPHGAVALWEGDRVTIWESTQGVFRVRDETARALGVPRSHVRVIMEHMGGGFGAKNNAGAHTLVAALLARRTGQPVSCILSREDEQTDTGHRPSTRQVVTLGARADGTLTAIDVVAEVPLGVNGWEASVVAVYHELYACPNVRTRETLAFVNQQQMQAFRAPGHVEGTFGLELAMDVLARELQIDPLELRRRNFAATDLNKGRPYSSNRLLACYDEGARRFDWANRAMRRNDGGGRESVARPDATSGKFKSGGGPSPGSRGVRRGFGLAAQVWGAGGGPPAYATVRVNSDGSIDVLAGTQDLGTGARTILAQIAAEALGARLQDVRVILGDTERTPYTGNSWGSMTTPSVGPAVRAAADEARRRLLDAARAILGDAIADAEVADSQVRTPDGATCATFTDIMRKLGNVMIIGEGSRGPNPSGIGFMSFGVQFAEVEVDIETGTVRVERIVAVHDAGRIINPLLAESQLAGGILQGLGYALLEERIVDPASGRTVNPSLHDYRIPTFADVPVIDATCLDVPDTVANHVGARGLAEPPIIPTAPAIANAVADALGVEVREIPLTPWRVLAALAALTPNP